MFKNPFSFKGRIRRSEYVISLIIYIILISIISSFQESLIEKIIQNNQEITLFYLSFLIYIPLLWFLLAQNTKRCHDRGNSGVYQFIPFYMLWLIFGEGNDGSNQYGEDPWNDKINEYLRRQARYKSIEANSTSKKETTYKNDNSKSIFFEKYSKTIQMIKQLNFKKSFYSYNFSSNEIIIASVVVGALSALIFGSAFGETIYYFNNGNRGNAQNFDYSEFHISYIALVASFIVTTGITYILLNRKNGEKL